MSADDSLAGHFLPDSPRSAAPDLSHKGTGVFRTDAEDKDIVELPFEAVDEERKPTSGGSPGALQSSLRNSRTGRRESRKGGRPNQLKVSTRSEAVEKFLGSRVLVG